MLLKDHAAEYQADASSSVVHEDVVCGREEELLHGVSKAVVYVVVNTPVLVTIRPVPESVQLVDVVEVESHDDVSVEAPLSVAMELRVDETALLGSVVTLRLPEVFESVNVDVLGNVVASPTVELILSSVIVMPDGSKTLEVDTVPIIVPVTSDADVTEEGDSSVGQVDLCVEDILEFIQMLEVNSSPEIEEILSVVPDIVERIDGTETGSEGSFVLDILREETVELEPPGELDEVAPSSALPVDTDALVLGETGLVLRLSVEPDWLLVEVEGTSVLVEFVEIGIDETEVLEEARADESSVMVDRITVVFVIVTVPVPVPVTEIKLTGDVEGDDGDA